MLSICAVIAIRNEASYLRVLLPLLASQAIDVVIIDNDSTDDGPNICREFRRKPVIGVEHLPYSGLFSLSAQLKAKQKVYNSIDHDWVIHQDADEILQHYKAGFTLRDAIEQAHADSYNALNFDEFVFLPEPDSDYNCRANYYTGILRYYFFEPAKNRLNRAWRRALQFDNSPSGGHTLSGLRVSIYPANHILRHYIVLSDEHARRKYLHRTFSEEELGRGWHGNRVGLTERVLALPEHSDFLMQLEKHDSVDFRRNRPALQHYWEWEPR